MQCLKAKRSAAISAISKRLIQELQSRQKITWLVSGGSNVESESQIMKNLVAKSQNYLSRLTILPMDERYGPAGYKNSNIQQLRAAGFEADSARLIDVLANNLPFTETVKLYNSLIAKEFSGSELIVGQFGLGGDGHVAGILPKSEALAEDNTYVFGYKGPDFIRMTLTIKALSAVDVGYVLAFGANKQSALARLLKNNETVTDLPAQILYKIPELYVYNDVIESEG